MREEIIGNARLILGDCREVLPTLGKVDAVVSDPPYGIDYRPEGGGKVPKTFTNADRLLGDDLPFDPRPLLPLASKIIIWGGNNYAHLLPASRGWLLWDKKDGLNPNSFSDAEVAWTNIDMPMRIISHRWSGYNKDSEIGIQRVHPTQKPVAVIEWCLGFLPDAETILDPFMGSGTTGVACAKLGRSFIGIEIEPRYFDIACRRIEDAYKQADMFVSAPPEPVAKQEALL